MNKFDLEKALAGDKVVTRDGREVTQLHKFTLGNGLVALSGVVGDSLPCFTFEGDEFWRIRHDGNYDLFMAPKKLSGFVNVYRDDGGELFFGDVSGDKLMSKQLSNISNHEIVARIDLSQSEEVHGL